jgi:predicted enzyme related to lactoylglutathione lyase
MIVRATFVIAVPDLARSAAFYRDVLGFKVREIGPGWLMFESGSCRIMAGECPDALPAAELGDHSYFAYLTVDDAETLCRHVTATAVAAGGEMTKPLADEPWGMREFGLKTVDGHRIMIGQDLSPTDNS